MKIRQLLISFLLAASTLGATAQVSKTYYVSKPGTLISMMTEEEANSITHLTLTGKLNAEDFRHLRDEFSSLKVLDISNAEIKMYSGKAGTYPNGKFYIYMANFVPAYAFSNVVNGVTKGKQTLEKVILSEKIKNIEDAAFKGCDNLKICQIRKKTAPNLLPEALDLVLVPCTAFDADCFRVGMGKGYYDRYLPRCKNAVKIGIAFEAQRVEHAAVDEHDQRLDAYVTERGIYKWK